MTITEDWDDIDNQEDAKETSPEEVTSADINNEKGADDDVVSQSSINSIRSALQHEDDGDKDTTTEEGCCLRLVNGHGCCGRCMSRWPRFWALFLGVVLPLWLLIVLSIFFGFFLAESEAPTEIQANNEVLEAQASVGTLVGLIIKFVGIVPTVCFELYLAERDASDIEAEFDQIFEDNEQLLVNMTSTSSDDAIATILSDETIIINKTDLYEFMDTCGSRGRPIVESLVKSSAEVGAGAFATDLTFNWIRCVPWANGLNSGIGRRVNKTSLQPENQDNLFRQVWREDQQQLNEQYMQEYLDDNETVVVATIMAFADSVRDATGGSKCEVNAAASAWFWFTVLTTIGYGNQAPTTTAGRSMVYALGFLSILAFGCVLAMAGYIVSLIFDDLAIRNRLQILTNPWVACLVWGAGYYSWMILIAGYTQRWKKDRLDIDFSLRQGYWFSYVSTTTVGLGDIFLEPEVIIGRDLVVFPLLFLVGFVFLSSFLGKLVEAISSMASKKRPNIVGAMLRRLKETQVVPDLHDIEELADFGSASKGEGDEVSRAEEKWFDAHDPDSLGRVDPENDPASTNDRDSD